MTENSPKRCGANGIRNTMGNTSMDQNALDSLNAYQERNKHLTRGEAVRDLLHKAKILELEEKLLQKTVEENEQLKAEAMMR